MTATEIAAFVYCREQWRLQYGLGMKPGDREALDAGTRNHERKAVAERVAGGSISLGWRVVGVALVLLLGPTGDVADFNNTQLGVDW